MKEMKEKEMKLGRRQEKILKVLYKTGPVAAFYNVALFWPPYGINYGYAFKTYKSLEKKGLVRLWNLPKPKRGGWEKGALMIELTPKGRKVAEELLGAEEFKRKLIELLEK